MTPSPGPGQRYPDPAPGDRRETDPVPGHQRHPDPWYQHPPDRAAGDRHDIDAARCYQRHPGRAAGDWREIGPEGGPVAFRVLHVCVANVCRSVLAERLMRRGLDARLGDLAGPVRLASAGTRAEPGLAMHADIGQILRERGADVVGFASRRLTPGIVAGADLVLTATRDERNHVIAMVPAALRRAFMLKEFARLAPQVRLAPPAGAPATAPELVTGAPTTGRELVAGAPATAPELVARARALVAGALAMRGRTSYVDPAADDLPDPDPTRGDLRACADNVAGAVDLVLDALCGQPARRYR